jgi:outer membrane protein OmpA-like peptidoglycan-associated protein
MTYIISHFWLWLLPIFIAGIATAILTRQAEAKGKVAPWLIWCGLAFAAGALTALLDVLLGRAGVWLETALASFVVYMLGAGAGALLRKSDLAEHKGWALGLIPAALLWFAGNVFGTPNMEADLKKSVGAAIKDAREDARNFQIVGRDVLLSNDVADRAALTATIRKIEGVRAVIETEKTLAETPALGIAEQAADVAKDAAEKAAEAGKEAVETGWADAGKAAHDVATKAAGAGNDEKKPVHAGKAVANQSNTAAPAASAAEKAAAAKSALKSLPVSGPLDAAACQAALNATLVLDKIDFRSGSVKIGRASAYALDRLAALLQRCPEQKVEIGVHADNVGDEEGNQALSQRRADKVARYLANEGVAAARLTGVGYGDKQPIASNDHEEGRGENRRIEFILK